MRRVRVTVVSTRIKRVQTTMRRGHESVESSGSQEERCSECEKNHERASLKRVGARGETAEVKEKKVKKRMGSKRYLNNQSRFGAKEPNGKKHDDKGNG